MNKMFKNKAGSLNTGTIEKTIMSIVLIVLLFSILATMLPEAETAGDTLNESGVPFGSFFAAGGIVFVIIMAGMLMKVVGSFLGKGRK